MNYKKWNDAFVNYFFIENKDEEILLYADESVINKIGSYHNLGGVEDFLKAIIVNEDDRRLIYLNNAHYIPNGDLEFNRKIKAGTLFEFADFLSEKKNTKVKLPFLNYVILAIYAKTDLSETDRSYYLNLNNFISSIDNRQKKISSSNIKLDDLFNKIELFDRRFKNKLIGNLAFMGLLKYQVVLSPKEKYEFEETLFKYKITIHEDSNYHSFANKFLSVVPNHYNTLREKIKLGGNDPVYARWFLNRGRNFNSQNFSATNPNVAINKQVGEIALVFNPENEKHLYLSVNTAGLGAIKIEGYQFSLNEKREDGFSTSPVILNNKKDVSFKNYDTIENEDYKFSFLPLKGVNFFQKNSLNHYQQVLNPIANTPTYIVVKNDNKEINNWEKWKNKNTTGCGISIDLTKTESLFTDNYVLYFAKSINKEYYTRNTNIAAIDYSKELYIKKIGGYKLKARNTYFDVALPSFKIQNPIGIEEELKVIIKTNGIKDRDVEYFTSQNNIVKLFLSTDKVILEAQEIEVTFKLGKLIKEFSFSVIPSEIKATPLESLFKLNGWGVKSNSEENWYNGNEIKGSGTINIGNGRHLLEGLDNEHRAYNNYFIYLLSALANRKSCKELKYSDVLGLINLTKVYYDINNIDYTIDSYTNRSIIRNLIALEYLNKIKNDQNEAIFQITPPTLLKLERSFNIGGNQMYKLAGVRSRRLDQIIIEYCVKNNVCIKYLDFKYKLNQQQPFEHLILPAMFFIDSNINIRDLNNFVNKELGIILVLQDEHHIGDSLLNFIESVNSFKKCFLTASDGNYENQTFDEGIDPTLPRIIQSENEFSRRGQFYKKKYLRISENNANGIFSEDKILINWGKLYVSYKKEKTVLFLKEPQWNGKDYTLAPDILIPKTIVLPSILYKALTSINHGIPEIQKGFVVNASEIFEMQNKRFVYLDYYRINITKPERRENISRILTGSEDVLKNKQIAFYSECKANIRMYYSVCSTFSSVSDLIVFRDEDDAIIALCDNYKNVYLKSENGNDITIDNQKMKIVKLIKDDTTTINKIFSLIVTKNYNDLQTVSIIENKLVVETVKKEEIKILNLKANEN
jgi:hypothetical protein